MIKKTESISKENKSLNINEYLKKHNFKNFQDLINFNVKHGVQKGIWFEENAMVLNSKNTSNFECEPVHSENLTNLVKNKYKQFNKFIPNGLEKMSNDLGRVFNECIKHNQLILEPELKEDNYSNISQEKMHKTFVLSPKTGSAKSLTLKAYISLLKNESSLIVVKQVKDLIEYCADINEWSNDPNYARCHYTISDDHLRNELYVTLADLKEYKCIVITHSLFKQLKHTNRFDKVKYFKEKNRDLVVIDEKIQMHKHHVLTYDDCKQTSSFLKLEIERIRLINKDKSQLDEIQNLYDFVVLFEELFDNLIEDFTNKSTQLISSQEWYFLDDFKDMDKFQNVIEKYICDHPYLAYSMLSKNNEQLIKEQRTNLTRIVESMYFITTHMSLLVKSGKRISIHSLDHYENNFLSLVLLDATAHINPYYVFASKSLSKNLDHISIPNYKKYENVTFYLADGYKQGRNSIYKDSQIDILHEVKRYLKIAEDITSKNDNLLIIGHKNFIKYLEKQSKNDNIYFTYWGKHIGHNNWSHCNKIIVIGWNYIPRIEHYVTVGTGFNGFQSGDAEVFTKYQNVIKTISQLQIADDLVQGVSRGSLRNTIDSEGNCPKTDVFLFYKSAEDTEKIIRLVKKEFIGAIFKTWYPKDIGSIRKLTKTQIKIEDIIKQINTKLNTNNELVLTSSQVIDLIDIPKSTFHRLSSKPYFEEVCKRKEITYTYLDNRTKVFSKQ